MMLGPLINSAAIVFGSLIGTVAARYIPERLTKGLPPTFALSSFAIGITMVIKVQNVPVMIMALIVGTAFGEYFKLETNVTRLASFTQRKVARFLPVPPGIGKQEFYQHFTSMIVVFSASGLGIIGAITEGLNGNYDLLLVKSIMDFITAIIFACILGPSLALIAITQILVQGILFYFSQSIMPYMDAMTYADFESVGGIIMVAVGLRIAKIMNFSVINFLPALILSPFLTHLWRYWFGV